MVDMGVSLGQYIEHLKTIQCWANQLRKAGILTSDPHSARTMQKIDIATELLGDPEKNPRGIPYRTVKTTYIYDKVLDILSNGGASKGSKSNGGESNGGESKGSKSENNCLPLLDGLITTDENDANVTVTHEEYTKYKPVIPESDVRDTNLYYLPEYTTVKTQQPFLVVLNFDKSLVQPGDLGPILKFFPLTRPGSYQGMALFVLLWKVVNMMSVDELLLFIIQTDSTYGAQTIMKLCETYLDDESKSIVKQSFVHIRELIQFSSLIRWIHQALKRQVFMNTDYKSIILMFGGVRDKKQVMEAMNTKDTLTKLKQIVTNTPPKVVDMISDVSYTDYGIQDKMGTTTTVSTHSMSMTSEGAYCTSSYKAEPKLTQSLLKHLSVFKQTVDSSLEVGRDPSKPFTNCFRKGTGETHGGRVRIPTSNWKDIKKFQRCFHIRQVHKTAYSNNQSAADVVEQLENLFYRQNVVQASAKWDAVSGKLTLSATGMTTSGG